MLKEDRAAGLGDETPEGDATPHEDVLALEVPPPTPWRASQVAPRRPLRANLDGARGRERAARDGDDGNAIASPLRDVGEGAPDVVACDVVGGAANEDVDLEHDISERAQLSGDAVGSVGRASVQDDDVGWLEGAALGPVLVGTLGRRPRPV